MYNQFDQIDKTIRIIQSHNLHSGVPVFLLQNLPHACRLCYSNLINDRWSKVLVAITDLHNMDVHCVIPTLLMTVGQRY